MLSPRTSDASGDAPGNMPGHAPDPAPGNASGVWPLALLVMVSVNVLLFQSHYLGKAYFPWDFIGGYHYHAVSWYLDNGPPWELGATNTYTPWTGGGFPTAWMFQNGAWYLPLAVVDALGIPYTLRTAVVVQCLHHVFAMFGQYLLARRFGAGWVASLFAALLFGAGVTYFSNAQHVDIVRGVAWMPWVLWALLPFGWDARGGTSVDAPTGRRRTGRLFIGRLFAVSLLARVFILHQFTVSAYPGILAAALPVFAVWVVVWHMPFLRTLWTLGRERLGGARAGVGTGEAGPRTALSVADGLSLVAALLVAALLLMPKYLPFLDIQLADGSLQPPALSEGFSLSDTLLILSTMFGDYEGELPHIYTMNSLWFSPFAVGLIAACGFVSRRHRVLTIILGGAFALFLFDVTAGFRLPRDLFSRYPVADYRGLLQALACTVVALSVSTVAAHGNRGGDAVSRALRNPWGVAAGVLVSGYGLWLIDTTDSPGNTVQLVAALGVVALLLLLAARRYGRTAAYAGGIGAAVLIASYSLHYDSRRSWMTAFAEEQPYASIYGPRYSGVPAGERPWTGGTFRPARFLADTMPGWLSNEYATAHFNSTFGLEGYNNLRGSRTVSTRTAALAADPALEPLFTAFMLQRSQALVAPAGTPVEAALRQWAEPCAGQPVCAVADVAAPSLLWLDFRRDGFNLALDGSGGDVRMVFNENAFPGWSVSAVRDGAAAPLELVDTPLGLLAVDVPAGTDALVAEYGRAAYRVAGLLAALGWLLLAGALALIWLWVRRPGRRAAPLNVSADVSAETPVSDPVEPPLAAAPSADAAHGDAHGDAPSGGIYGSAPIRDF